MTQEEDVLGLLDEPLSGETGAELPHLVPEQREVPVLDVEVVVLDERKDGPGEREPVVKGLPELARHQSAVFLADPVALRDDRFERTCDVLARLETLDIRADRRDRDARVVDPRAMVVREAVSEREREPLCLGLIEVGKPLLAAPFQCEVGPQFLLVPGRLDAGRHSELERPAGEPAQLLVRAQDEDVDPRNHRRDRLVGDAGEGPPAQLVEEEVGPIAQVVELEVVLHDAVEPIQHAVVGADERVGGADAAELGDDGLVLELG